MLNLPSVPTDNIYKFFAFSGVVIMVASAVLFVQVLLNTIDSVHKLAAEQQLSIANHIRESGGVPTFKTGVDVTADNDLENYKNAMISQFKFKTDLLKDQLYFSLRALTLFFAAGFLIGWRGFHLWYHNVQKFQDEILVLQRDQEAEKLRKLRMENAPSPTDSVPKSNPAVIPNGGALPSSDALVDSLLNKANKRTDAVETMPA
jgi:hypothetical protein